MVNEPVEVHVSWPRSFRLIRSIFPPIDLFEDIADPRDWEALASAEAKTNPRVLDQLGTLALVPVARRVSGPGASWLMAPFVHARSSRFSDGSFGVYYAGDTEDVALCEVAHHHGRFMAKTGEAAGWSSQFRMLVGQVDCGLHDVSGVDGVLDPVDYTVAQALGASLREAGANGVLYPSVRAPEGRCIGVFWPDLLPIPVQGDHYDMHWDGVRVDRLRNCASGRIYALP